MQLVDGLLDSSGLFSELWGGASRFLNQLRETHSENGKVLPRAVVQFASNVAPLFFLSAQEAMREFANQLRLAEDFGVAMLEFGGSGAHFSFERLGETAIIFFVLLELGNVDTSGVEKNNLALVIKNGEEGKIDETFGGLCPGVAENLAVLFAARDAGGGFADFVLRFGEMSPPSRVPEFAP